MLSLHEVDEIFASQPAELLDIVHELRNLIVLVLPSAAEKRVWQGLAYFDPARGGVIKGGLCQISIKNQAVILSFIHGAFLPDPDHLLAGTARYKKEIRLTAYEQTPWPALQELLQASAAFDPVSLTFHH
jgi:hypothetical protein